MLRTYSGRLWFQPGDGTGKLIGAGWNTMRAFAAPGDLSDDGSVDLSVSDSSGKLWLYPGNGKGCFGARKLIGTGSWGAFNSLLGVGDVYGDSHPDLIAAQAENFHYYGMVCIYYGRSGGAIGNAGSFANADHGDVFA